LNTTNAGGMMIAIATIYAAGALGHAFMAYRRAP
jgi:hypothetical protein